MKQLKLCRINKSALHSCNILTKTLKLKLVNIMYSTKVGYISNQLRIYPTFCKQKDGIGSAGERSISQLSSNHPIGGCYVY